MGDSPSTCSAIGMGCGKHGILSSSRSISANVAVKHSANTPATIQQKLEDKPEYGRPTRRPDQAPGNSDS